MDVDQLQGLVWQPIHHSDLCHATECTTPGCSPRAVICFHNSWTRSTSFICPKDLIMARKMGAETTDDMEGNRLSNCDRGSMFFNLLQASTAAESKASSASVSSTRSKTRLMFRWGVFAVRSSMRHPYRPHLVRKAQKTRDSGSHHTEREHTPTNVTRDPTTITTESRLSGFSSKMLRKFLHLLSGFLAPDGWTLGSSALGEASSKDTQSGFTFTLNEKILPKLCRSLETR